MMKQEVRAKIAQNDDQSTMSKKSTRKAKHCL